MNMAHFMPITILVFPFWFVFWSFLMQCSIDMDRYGPMVVTQYLRYSTPWEQFRDECGHIRYRQVVKRHGKIMFTNEISSHPSEYIHYDARKGGDFPLYGKVVTIDGETQTFGQRSVNVPDGYLTALMVEFFHYHRILSYVARFVSLLMIFSYLVVLLIFPSLVIVIHIL